MIVAATAVCALACAVLVAADLRGDARLRIASKLTASAAFVVVGLVAARSAGWSAYATWVWIGLVFGALGDAALLGRSSRAFLAGLGAFLVGHLAYVVALAQLMPPARWPAAAGWLAALPIVVGGAALVRLWPRLGGMAAPVVAYVAAIVAMVVGAIAVAHAGLLAPARATQLAIGAALFFASDLAVARDRFIAHDVRNKLWGLPAYFAGQLLIAWSVAA